MGLRINIMTRERWGHFFLGGLLIILLSHILNRLFMPLLISLYNSDSKILYFIGINTSFVLLALSFLTVVYLYHKLTIKKMITSNNKINLRRLCSGFALWFAILVVPLFINRYTQPETLTKNTNYKSMLPFLLLSLTLTPIQTAIEELIFRSYLIRGLKSLYSRFFFPLLTSSIVFALLHMWNPEIKGRYYLFFMTYFTMALLLGYLTLKYNGIEYSLGIHYANNFFAINLLNYKDSPLPTSSLYFAEDIPPESTLFSILISGAVFLIIITLAERHYDKKHNI